MNQNEPGNVFAFAERTGGQPLPAPRTPDERPRWVGRVVWAAAGTAVVLLIGGGAVYGAAAYTRSNVCATIQSIGASAAGMTGSDSVAIPDSALDSIGQRLQEQAGLLILHQDLEQAVNLLVADTKQLQAVDDTGVNPAYLPQVVTLFKAVDGHFKQAQTACGMPDVGLLSTNMGTALMIAAKNERSGRPFVAPTPAPLPAPAYTASPDELAAAQDDVNQHRDDLADLNADAGASSADRAVASYELAAARQRLADLKAGQPGAFHQALELRGAKAYLAEAKENLQQVKADTSAADVDRANARADVKKWQQRVKELS
ncbi:hypothetical protein [Actinoplanes sp. HUAS TT8]|uniref:hypothetical protein n=1 Tax=Actinoplanes sp. HUAS TT8 TaxID=3447453 RepID=UPI003F5225F4